MLEELLLGMSWIDATGNAVEMRLAMRQGNAVGNVVTDDVGNNVGKCCRERL